MKPVYYDRFSCIADKCSFNCCEQWKIGVDTATARLWKKTEAPDGGKLNKYITTRDGQRVVCLDSHGSCPFLNEKGLCKIVIMHGDSVLSKTCQDFPREQHEFEGRIEYNLMATCPEVLDFIYREGFSLAEQSDVSLEQNSSLFALRALLLSLMEDETLSAREALRCAFFLVSEALRQEGDWKIPSESELAELKAVIKELPLPELLDSFIERNELLLDVTENYRSQGLYQKHLTDVCVLAEDYETRLDAESPEYDEETIPELLTAMKMYSDQMVKLDYDRFFRNLIAEEIYANSLNSESDCETMLMRIEWIAIEMAVIDHFLLLNSMLKGLEHALSYEAIRDVIIVVMRMTGYDEEDIADYMEDCFSDLVWDFSYLKLITD